MAMAVAGVERASATITGEQAGFALAQGFERFVALFAVEVTAEVVAQAVRGGVTLVQLRDKELGPRAVPILVDEARTFGSFFRRKLTSVHQ